LKSWKRVSWLSRYFFPRSCSRRESGFGAGSPATGGAWGFGLSSVFGAGSMRRVPLWAVKWMTEPPFSGTRTLQRREVVLPGFASAELAWGKVISFCYFVKVTGVDVTPWGSA